MRREVIPDADCPAAEAGQVDAGRVDLVLVRGKVEEGGDVLAGVAFPFSSLGPDLRRQDDEGTVIRPFASRDERRDAQVVDELQRFLRAIPALAATVQGDEKRAGLAIAVAFRQVLEIAERRPLHGADGTRDHASTRWLGRG